MLAHFIEASVMFQNGTVYMLYGLIFGTLATIAVVNYMAAINREKKNK